MGKFFHYEGKLMSLLTKITDILYVGLLWFLFSIPLITIGASTTALYYTVHRSLIHNYGHIRRDFWHAFKSNFKQATISWLLVIIFTALAFVDFYILKLYLPLEQNQHLDYILLCIMLALVLFWASYLFPYIARFQDNTRTVLKNSFFMALFNLPRTFVLLIVFVAMFIGVFSCPPLLLVLIPTYMCIANIILEQVFKKYMSPEDLAAEEERNCIGHDIDF